MRDKGHTAECARSCVRVRLIELVAPLGGTRLAAASGAYGLRLVNKIENGVLEEPCFSERTRTNRLCTVLASFSSGCGSVGKVVRTFAKEPEFGRGDPASSQEVGYDPAIGTKRLVNIITENLR